MWKLSYAVNVGNRKKRKKTCGKRKQQIEEKKNSTFDKNNPFKEHQDVHNHMNASKYQSRDKEPISKFDKSQYDEEANKSNHKVAYEYPNKLDLSEKIFSQYEDIYKHELNQPYNEGSSDFSKHVLQNSVAQEQDEMTPLDCFEGMTSSPEEKNLEKNIDKTSDISDQKTQSRLQDISDLSGSFNFHLPSTSKCIFIATENDIYVETKLRKEGEDSVERPPDLQTDELSSSCNDPPRKTCNTEIDNCNSPDNDHSFTAPVSSSTNSKQVFIATESIIYVRKKARHGSGTSSEKKNESRSHELNSSCNGTPDGTFNIKSNKSPLLDESEFFTFPHNLPTASENIFIATESVIYLKTDSKHNGKVLSKPEGQLDVNEQSTSSKTIPCDFKLENSNISNCDQSLSSPRLLSTTSKHVFVASESIIRVKTESKQNGEIFVSSEIESNSDGRSSPNNAIPNGTLDLKPDNSHFYDNDISFTSSDLTTLKHDFIATEKVIYIGKEESRDGEISVETMIESHTDELSSEISSRKCDAAEFGISKTDNANENTHENLLGSNMNDESTKVQNFSEMESQERKQLNAQKIDLESHVDKLSSFSNEIPSGAFDVVNKDTLMLNITNENSIEPKSLSNYQNLSIDNVDAEPIRDKNYTDVKSPTNKRQDIQGTSIEAHTNKLGASFIGVPVFKETIILTHNIINENLSESKLIPHQENLSNVNVGIQFTSDKSSEMESQTVNGQSTQETKIKTVVNELIPPSKENSDIYSDFIKPDISTQNVENEKFLESKLIPHQENMVTNDNPGIQSTDNKNSEVESLTVNIQNTQETKIEIPDYDTNSFSKANSDCYSDVMKPDISINNVTSENSSESKLIPHEENSQTGNIDNESMNDNHFNMMPPQIYSRVNTQETKIKTTGDEISSSSKEILENSSDIVEQDITINNVSNENSLDSKLIPSENFLIRNVDIKSTTDESSITVKSQISNAQKSNNVLPIDRQNSCAKEISDGASDLQPDISLHKTDHENSLESKSMSPHENLSSDKKHVKSDGDKNSADSEVVKNDSNLKNIVPENQSTPTNSDSKSDSTLSNLQINSTTSSAKTKNKSEPEKILKMSRHVECNLNDYDPRISKFPLKIYSKNRKEYIKKKVKNGQLFYSSEFIEKLPQTEIIIRIHGPDNLLILNKDSFAARIILGNKNMLNFSGSFQSNKLEFLKRITIMKILEDELLDRRNKTYKRFKEILQDRVNRASEHADCTEDLLQLSNICFEMLKRRTRIGSIIILDEIIKNKYVSTTLKVQAEQLLISENDLNNRNQYLPRFHSSVSPIINDFITELHNIYKLGIINHKNNLLKKYPYRKFKSMFQLLDINYLPDIIVLSLSSNDIKLFSELVTIANQQSESPAAIIPHEYITSIWNNFFIKIKALPKYESIKQLGPLTCPIYLFLFKSFCELVTDISNIIEIPPQNLLKNENGKFSTLNSLKWPKNTSINRALEEQYRLIFKLMEHFEPGKYSNERKFKYRFQLKNFKNKTKWQIFKGLFKRDDPENIPEERLVWLYILDSGLAHIIPDRDANGHVEKLTHSLQNLFAKFLEKVQYDRHETFRIVVQNITKFVGQISTYISTMDSVASATDHKILDKQIEFISSILNDRNDHVVVSQFANLMDVYKEYWKNRESIVGKILSKCPCKVFEEVMKKDIFLRLLGIVDEAQCKNVTMQVMIQYFRLYNEFLQHLKGVEFEWVVSEKYLTGVSRRNHVKLINAEKKYYRVTNSEEFVTILKTKKSCIPENYLIIVVKELLNIVKKSLSKQNWTDFEQIKATGDLFLAIGHSLIHFKDQTNYVDFENFVRNNTLPFNDVLMNSEKYADFQNRLENVENFYLYTNKQNEIGIDNALNLCVVNSGSTVNQDFVTNFDQSVLKECYDKYSKKISDLQDYLETSDTDHIIADIRKTVENISPIEEWTPEFKQDAIPSLLADLAAVWTIIESKDLSRIGKRIEPHIIQILCIFRLLGVDQKSNGIDKHLAQVLTGQGKSIVLGLLSSLLAVTGHKSIITCYSEYLANRDKDAFRKFFNVLNEFDVENKVSYKTINDVVNSIINQNINGKITNLRSLVTDLILDKIPITITASERKLKSTILLIDEVDVFFSDTFYGNLYRPVSTVIFPALLEIQPKIWEIVEDGIYDKNMVLEKITEFINEMLKNDKHEEFRDFTEITNDLFKNHLEKMITSAIDVSKSKNTKNSINYRFKLDTEGRIAYRKENGMYVTNTYLEYDNMFNYFLLKDIDYEHKYYQNYGYLCIKCGCISYANLPEEFTIILGVSGTLTTMCDYEKIAVKSYGINTMSVMPSFFGDSKLRFNPLSDCILKVSELDWLDSIYDSVSNKIQDGRAVIVFFDTIMEINLFEEKYRSRIDRLHKLTGNEEPSTLEWYISESGVSQTVTLATRLMGRGVDFKSNDMSVEKKGGVHVIQSFFSLDVKEEVQIQGRTARKDNKGSYEQILCHQHLNKINCLKKIDGNLVAGYRDLCEVRKKIADIKGTLVEGELKKSAKKHDLTMKFFKSFADYTPSKRMDYFSRYPFVELKD